MGFIVFMGLMALFTFYQATIVFSDAYAPAWARIGMTVLVIGQFALFAFTVDTYI